MEPNLDYVYAKLAEDYRKMIDGPDNPEEMKETLKRCMRCDGWCRGLEYRQKATDDPAFDAIRPSSLRKLVIQNELIEGRQRFHVALYRMAFHVQGVQARGSAVRVTRSNIIPDLEEFFGFNFCIEVIGPGGSEPFF